MMWTRLPLRLVFALHRPGFDAVARHHYEDIPMLRPEPPVRQRVGLYAVEHVYVDVHGADIFTGSSTFRYNPGGDPWPYYATEFVHLGGAWHYHTGEESGVLAAPV